MIGEKKRAGCQTNIQTVFPVKIAILYLKAGSLNLPRTLLFSELLFLSGALGLWGTCIVLVSHGAGKTFRH